MENTYITVTGLRHHYGCEFIERGMKVKLMKDPENEMDAEAIKVEMEGLKTIGYVANSPYTVLGESISAGRLYDRIGDTAEAEILYKLPKALLCKVLMD